MSGTELAAVLTAIATLIGALGWGAFRSGKKDLPIMAQSLLTSAHADRIGADFAALIRGFQQEARTDARDTRDRLIKLQADVDTLRRK